MFIVTERLLLRPLWPEDADVLSARMGDADVLRNLGTPPSPFTVARAMEKIAADLASGPDMVSLGIFDRRSVRELAGGIAFGPRPDRGGDIALSYWIAQDWWGQRIAVEAGQAVLEHAFLGRRLPQLKARVYADNPKSGRVLQSLGFADTGRLSTQHCVPRGESVECREFVLSREAWEDGRALRRANAARHAA